MHESEPIINENNSIKLKPGLITRLRPYYEDNCSIHYTSKKLGMSNRTVGKYFGVWNKIIVEQLDGDFIIQQKQVKARGLLALEVKINLINETLRELRKLNDTHIDREQKLVKKDKTHVIELDKWLTQTISRLTKDSFNMEQVKIMIELRPTADVSLQLQIDEMLSKVKPEDLQELMEQAKEKED